MVEVGQVWHYSLIAERWATEVVWELPEPWPDEPRDKEAKDGTNYRAFLRPSSLYPLEQRSTRQVGLERWDPNQRVAAEEYALRGTMYLMPELRLMLEVAGFTQIEVLGDFQDRPAEVGSEELVFIAVMEGAIRERWVPHIDR